jgi:hypothetical protein
VHRFSKIFFAIGLSAFIAQASTIYEFTGTGTGTVPTNGDVVFTINSNNIMITLTNTGGPGDVQDIGSELTGVVFTLGGGSPLFTDSSLSGLASGGVDCSSGTCVSSVPPASPYGWQFSGTSTFSLLAGNGSYKPEAIVNDNIAVADGVANAQHNPLLLGPVTFTIDFTGAAPTSVNSVIFDFGTGPTTVTGDPCTDCGGVPQSLSPEPLSMGLTGGGLVLLGLLRRRVSRIRS